MTLLWYITIIGMAAALGGSYFLFKTVKRTSEDFSKSLMALFIASIFGVATHILVGLFGILSLNIENIWWNYSRK